MLNTEGEGIVGVRGRTAEHVFNEEPTRDIGFEGGVRSLTARSGQYAVMTCGTGD